jgi:hypothetical protein
MSAPTAPFTAREAAQDIRETLIAEGFDVNACTCWHHPCQSLTYRMPNGDRFKVTVTKLRGR